MSTLDKIKAQEKKDRFVAKKCLQSILKNGRNLIVVGTDLYDNVDLNCSVYSIKREKTIPFNVEIKERYKSDWQLLQYPEAELKVEKYERMRNATPEGVKLLYMVLLNNQKCLLFDLDTLDWEKVKEVQWNIKKTQMDDNSPVVATPTFLIPYDMAIATCDCTDYFNEYNTNITEFNTYYYE